MKRSLFLFPKWSCLIAVLQSLGSKGFPITSSSKGFVPANVDSGLPSSATLPTASFSFLLPSTTQLKLQVRSQSQQPKDEENGTWPPRIRQVMGGIAVAGALETAFLTYEKLSGSLANLCGTDGNCNTVLVGPYSNLPFTEIPLSAAGFVAYTLVAFLALQPLLATDSPDDSQNQVLLTAITTAMATFSIGLMILLFGVLQTTCPYCIFSATCSVLLAKLAWILGLPKEEDAKGAAGTVSTGFLAAIVGTVLLFVSAEPDFSPSLSLAGVSSSLDTSMTLLASSATKRQQQQQQLYSPPEITTDSSRRALELATNLQALDAKMYGAYWCSHCYDQKEVLGKQAFGKITYVECSKDGVNSQAKLCRSREVPGYPTWEIQGQLYPGQQDLEELEELVQTIRSGGGSTAATPVLSSS